MIFGAKRRSWLEICLSVMKTDRREGSGGRGGDRLLAHREPPPDWKHPMSSQVVGVNSALSSSVISKGPREAQVSEPAWAGGTCSEFKRRKMNIERREASLQKQREQFPGHVAAGTHCRNMMEVLICFNYKKVNTALDMSSCLYRSPTSCFSAGMALEPLN